MPQPTGTGGPAVYSYAQLEGLWINAATPKLGRVKAYALAPLMAAIAEAESGGNPNALNASDNGGTQSSFGLWQISTGTHTPPAQNWADPGENANLAVEKYRGQGLTAWGTYNSGAYRPYLSDKTSPDFNLPGNPNLHDAGKGLSGDLTGMNTCLIGIPQTTVPIIPGVFSQTITGGICLLSKTQASRVAGAALMLLGGLIMLVPVQIFVTGKAAAIILPIAGNKVTSSVRNYVPEQQAARKAARASAQES